MWNWAGTGLARKSSEARREAGMIVVIFEVMLEPGRSQRYIDLAGELRDQLADLDGFLSIERFQSLTTENKLVSLSFWRDREAVEAWYRLPDHRAAQGEGRAGIFRDYRIRVAEVFRDYDMAAGRPET
jgi:heme-degrading monooxygenase HmoA